MAIPFSVPDQLPFLQAICWQIKDIHGLTPQEILKCYERGWHYRGVVGNVGPEEQAFIQTLSQYYGSWLNAMAQRVQHQKILDILGQLDADFLHQCQAYFGGGTLLTLVYDEYRFSQDIDFLCSSTQGYRQLRRAVMERQLSIAFSDPGRTYVP
ncbi:MAG: nucleotidyl transferase AbiEii/AbiGii toxin family protein [Cyanobacteria bacterium J06636_16]